MGVRGKGHATIIPEKGAEKLEKLINRFLANSNKDLANWLLTRKDTEVAICIEPLRIYSWDYSGRMK